MTDGQRRSIALLVVNYGSSALLARNIAPLTRARPDLLTVIVDNRTTPREREAVQTLGASEGWHVLLNEDNAGFGAAMNTAAAAAGSGGAEVLLLLNPDATISPEAVDRLARELDDESLVAPMIERSDGTPWSRGSDLGMRDGRVWGRARRPEGAEVVEWLTGACLMLTVALWERIGGFEESYFLYWEDVDLSWKVQRAGGRVRLVSQAVATHDAGGTQGGGVTAHAPRSFIYYYFNVRNRLLFAGLRLDRDERTRWQRASAGVVWDVLRIGGGRRHLLRSFAPWRAALLGVIDGWTMGRTAARGRAPRTPRTESRLRGGPSR